MKIQYVNGFVIAGAMAFSAMALAANHMNPEYRLGQIKIESPYTRSTAPGQKVAGGFMKIDLC
jgi:copper(I)-binding protein